MIILREKICALAGIRTQISSSPYWWLNQFAHWDTHTDQGTNLSLIQVFNPRLLMNATFYNSLGRNPQVGIFSLDLLISASHLVLNDINIENLYIR